MISSPNQKAVPPSYSESQALAQAELTGSPHPTDVDNAAYEEDQRPLPSGWVRQWDSKTEHYFYVDTNANPPRSVWEHPDDLVDEQHSSPIASSIREETFETMASPDTNRTATPNQHTPLVDQLDFIFPARRKKHYGPIGLLLRLIFNAHSESSDRRGYSSVGKVYAPPTYPMSRCAQRRAERRARKWERREQYWAALEAMRESRRSRDGYGSRKKGCCSRSRC